MAKIDPTARVENPAGLADDVEIGPFCIVGPDVVLKPGVRLLSHVNVQGATTIGARTTVYPFASLGTPPQSVHYKGERTELVIGEECQIREHVTANIGTISCGTASPSNAATTATPSPLVAKVSALSAVVAIKATLVLTA